jgi:hypothetical protein
MRIVSVDAGGVVVCGERCGHLHDLRAALWNRPLEEAAHPPTAASLAALVVRSSDCG